MKAIDVIEFLPAELAARIQADEYFADIPVVLADKGNILAEVQRLQGVITKRGGKSGIFVVALQLLAEDKFPNLQFGPMTLAPAFQVIEQRELNLDPLRGTGKSARQVARRLRDVVKSYGAIGIVKCIRAAKNCIEPIPFDDATPKNLIGYQVNFECEESDSEVLVQCQMPVVSVDGSNQVNITSATAAARIYFTTDESLPVPNSPASTLYAEPFANPQSGTAIRACAYRTATIASWVNRFITP